MESIGWRDRRSHSTEQKTQTCTPGVDIGKQDSGVGSLGGTLAQKHIMSRAFAERMLTREWLLASGALPFSLLDEEDLWQHLLPPGVGKPRRRQKRLRGTLTAQHLHPFMHQNWTAVHSWITFHPDEAANFVDSEGHSALHHACLYFAPASIVEALLYTAPDLADVSNKKSETALHWAIRLSLPLDVIRLILKSSPYAGFTMDQRGTTPLSLLLERHEEQLRDTFRAHGRERMEQLPCWKRIMCLVHPMGGTSDDEGAFPLHAITHCPSSKKLFRFALDVFKDDCGLRDSQGRLPLHVAATTQQGIRLYGSPRTLELLAEAYPKAAGVKDANGRYPLHLAIHAGKAWMDGLDLLIAGAPDTLSVTDVETGLLPFQLAATAGKERDETIHLSTIYSFLRRDPASVGWTG